MKLAVILPSLMKRGPIIVAQEIVKALVNKVEFIDVFYFDDITELEFPCSTFKISFFDKIDFDKYDIIHSHTLRPDLYLFLNKRHIKKAKIITTLHQYNYPYLKEDYNFIVAYFISVIWKIVLKRMDNVVTLTKDMQNYYRNENIDKLSCINNGIAFVNIHNSFDQELDKIKGECIILGTSCLLIKRKGLEQIIWLLKENENFVFVLIGDGPEKQNLIKLSNKLGVSDRFLLMGFKLNPLIYYHYFDIFVMASRNEGMPMALLEAASLHMPVVCSDIPVLKELYSEDEVSFFQLDDIDSLGIAIKRILINKKSYSEKLFKKYSLLQNSECMANKYFILYKKITSNLE